MDAWDIIFGGLLGAVLGMFLPRHKSSEKMPAALEETLTRTKAKVDAIKADKVATAE